MEMENSCRTCVFSTRSGAPSAFSVTCKTCNRLSNWSDGKGNCETYPAEVKMVDETYPPLNITGQQARMLSGNPVDGYEELDRVLTNAYSQAAEGKGKDRHASKDEPFHKQQITEIARRLGDQCKHPQMVGPLYQVVKKAYESVRVNKESAIRELYGVINYTVAAILLLEDEDDPEKKKTGFQEPF